MPAPRKTDWPLITLLGGITIGALLLIAAGVLHKLGAF